jgi:hypothetical protein
MLQGVIPNDPTRLLKRAKQSAYPRANWCSVSAAAPASDQTDHLSRTRFGLASEKPLGIEGSLGDGLTMKIEGRGGMAIGPIRHVEWSLWANW